MAPNILSFGNKLLTGNNASEIFNDSRLPGDGLPEFQNKGLPVEHDPNPESIPQFPENGQNPPSCKNT
jgi:hypothetical protein